MGAVSFDSSMIFLAFFLRFVEGSWSADKRSGFGLIVGGSHCFMFANFQDGEPVGQHIAWDYDSDEIYLLDFALYTF
jgi:hypothetical protein